MLLSDFNKQNNKNLFRYVDSGMFHYYENSSGDKIFDRKEFEEGKKSGKYEEVFIDMDDFVPDREYLY